MKFNELTKPIGSFMLNKETATQKSSCLLLMQENPTPVSNAHSFHHTCQWLGHSAHKLGPQTLIARL